MSRTFLLRLSRSLCTESSISLSSPSVQTLPSSLRRDAREVSSLVRSARSACAIASSEGSDDAEREEARLLTRAALARYVSLVARGTPPVMLSAGAGRFIGDGEEEQEQEFKEAKVENMTRKLEPRNDVMHALGADIHELRMDIFKSNKQRVWIGWRGWF